MERGYEALTRAFKGTGASDAMSKSWSASMSDTMSSIYATGAQNLSLLTKGRIYNHQILEEFYREYTNTLEPQVVPQPMKTADAVEGGGEGGRGGRGGGGGEGRGGGGGGGGGGLEKKTKTCLGVF